MKSIIKQTKSQLSASIKAVSSQKFLNDLEILLRSKHAIIFIDSYETERVKNLLINLARKMEMPFMVWTRSKGLGPHYQEGINFKTLTVNEALNTVEIQHISSIYNFQGLASELENKLVAQKLYDAAKQFLSHNGGIIITGDIDIEIPHILKPLSTIIELPQPSAIEYRRLVEKVYRDIAKRGPVALTITGKEMAKLVDNLQGLSLIEAEKIVAKAIVEDSQLGHADIERVMLAKQKMLRQDGLLEYYQTNNSLAEVAGIDGLKKWLGKRRAIIQKTKKAKEFGLEFPKGILLLGIQGTGKSLCAKAVSSDWGLPLLKMDPSGLYNKYIGESEKNFKKATKLAEQMAPAILWIDEIEKAFGGSGDMDAGVSQRILGSFLSWLQDKKADVFVVATANDISKLPPELVRKGRFDEIFFVDLPDDSARAEIISIHLKKRRRDPKNFDLVKLAQISAGFSGAELEQAVISGLYTAFSESQDLNTEYLANEIEQTMPLSRTLSDRLEALRNWSKDRTVSAN